MLAHEARLLVKREDSLWTKAATGWRARTECHSGVDLQPVGWMRFKKLLEGSGPDWQETRDIGATRNRPAQPPMSSNGLHLWAG